VPVFFKTQCGSLNRRSAPPRAPATWKGLYFSFWCVGPLFRWSTSWCLACFRWVEALYKCYMPLPLPLYQ